MGDGEEHHGAPSVQPGGHQCTRGGPGHHGHQAALPLPDVRICHHLECFVDNLYTEVTLVHMPSVT